MSFSLKEALVSIFNKAITGRKYKHDFDIQQCVSYVFLKIGTVASETKVHPECKDEVSHQSILTYSIPAPKHALSVTDTSFKNFNAQLSCGNSNQKGQIFQMIKRRVMQTVLEI